MGKTTVEISDDLIKKAKALAARKRTTLRALIEQGLREALKADRASAKPFVLRDASVGGKGLKGEFAKAGWPRIREAIYEDRGA